MPKHIILNGFVSSESFRSHKTPVPGRVIPARDRSTHGALLQGQIESLRPLAASARDDAYANDVPGLVIEFEGFPGLHLAFESLAQERSGIELRNVRTVDATMLATVFVPDGKLDIFERKIEAYLTNRKNSQGKARDSRKLIDTIASLRAATLRSLWTEMDPFPSDTSRTFWWEVWLPVRRNRNKVIAEFRRHSTRAGLRVANGELAFPERTVLLLFATIEQLKAAPSLLNIIAELRLAKETADFFESLPSEEQSGWISDMLSRATFASPDANVPYVSMLDTGANRGHPLLMPAMETTDQHTVEPSWGTDDQVGHGTQMAGLALFGDLTPLLAGNGGIDVPIRLESVKLLDRNGGNSGDSLHHGYLTQQAVSLPEITHPARKRIFSIAISAGDGKSRGRPSAWSAAIDGLAAGTDRDDGQSRLLIAAAGNVNVADSLASYQVGNADASIHDPGQAWNPLTVGACTELVRINETGADDYRPLAGLGGLSPYSATSKSWDSLWPLKPDVVFEGGNIATDGVLASTLPSLSLLTTDHQPTKRLLTTAWATSAATYLGANFAAQLYADYPNLSAETIRALVVHSAEWSAEMIRMYHPGGRLPRKRDYANLVRHCGFGLPNLGRARESLANSLTLVTEDSIVPFEKTEHGAVRAREMHLHELPWPRDELLQLGAIDVELRVTLSYFVEPNPSSRDQRSQYRYQSHGLRFDVRRPGESTRDFRARINSAVIAEDQGASNTSEDKGWLLGANVRNRGSIHSDIWRGSAADLADRGVLAVYPATGWWKTRIGQRRWDSTAPYSLVVSIRTPETDVDLYAVVASKVGIVIGGDED